MKKSKTEHPAGKSGTPKENDVAPSKITSDSIASLQERQAAQLTRRFALSPRMASIVAPFVFGEAQQWAFHSLD